MEFVPLLVTAIAVAAATLQWVVWSLASTFRKGLNDQMTVQIAQSAKLACECMRAMSERSTHSEHE